MLAAADPLRDLEGRKLLRVPLHDRLAGARRSFESGDLDSAVLNASNAVESHVKAGVRVVVPEDEDDKKPKTLTRGEIAAVIDGLHPRDRLLFFSFTSLTGLRISETLGLQWRDVGRDAFGPTIAVRRQCVDGDLRESLKTTASRRDVALVRSLEADLSAHRERTRATPDDPLFASTRGTHQNGHNVRRRLRPAAVAAGVPWVTPHVFRHSLATELLALGYDTSLIAKVLGHRSEAFTRRVYIHPTETPRFDDLDAPAGS